MQNAASSYSHLAIKRANYEMMDCDKEYGIAKSANVQMGITKLH